MSDEMEDVRAAVEAVAGAVSGDLPEGFPFPVPEDAQVTMAAGDAETDSYSVMLRFPSERVPEVAEFYRRAFADAGYTIDKDSPGPGGGAEITARKDDLFARATVLDQFGSGQAGIGVSKILNP